MNQQQRREILKTSENPERQLDYISALSADFVMECDGMDHSVRLRYVPATMILVPASWLAYLSYLSKLTWKSMEELAITMVADTNDQLVPRWIEVSITCQHDGNDHQVIIDDREPGWNNENVLARLDSF